MLKRSLSLVALLLLVPMAAFAGTVATRVMTVGGNIAVNSGAAQTSANGTVTKSYTTAASVVMTPASGYAVSQLTLNGVNQPLANSLTIPLSSSNQTLAVSFAKQAVTVTASATTADGTVSPYGTYKTYSNTALVYTFTPNAGKSVVSIDGLPAGYVLKDTAGNVVTLPSAGTVKAYFTVTNNVNLVASFVSLSANAGAAQTVLIGSPATLNGSASVTTGTTYAWTQTGGPATATLSDATVTNPTVTAPAAGAYYFKLTATNGALVATSSTTVSVAATAGEAAQNQCVNCHNSSGVGPTVYANWNAGPHAANLVMCYDCHVGANVGSHPGVKQSCQVCHAAKGALPAEKTHQTATVDTGCRDCHTTGNNAHTANALTANDITVKHLGGKGAPGAGATADGQSISQYLTEGATCTDCHNSTNSVIAGFAEGGHGKPSDSALNAFTHYDWAGKTNNGTRQNGNCDRCHTAAGFLQLIGQPTTLALTAGKPGNVLVCVTCHSSIETGALLTDKTPAGSAAGALSNGYFALFSSAATAVPAGKTKIEISFPGYKNSSICVPCHSGRSTADVFVAVVDQAKAVNKNYSTIGTSYYQHAANMGQTFISKGGYDFTGKLASIAVTAHSGVKMGGSDTQGPCVGCHYSTDGLTHSLEINASSPTCIASACHASAPDLVGAKANFEAGVKALDTLIRSKFAPLQTVGGDLAAERANVRFGRFGKAAGVPADDATAKAAYGAWYNWQILATYDEAAWAHNPRYARQILNDTLGYLQTGLVKTSYAGTDVQAAIDAAKVLDATVDTAAAKSWVVAPGCGACHADKVTTFTTAGGYHAVVKKYACANCHTELHQTTDLAAQPTCRCHGDNGTLHPVKDALNAPDANCNKCHATTDVHSMQAADTTKGCVDCHDVAIATHNGKVDDNGGVRAILPEFNKRSHHITGGTPTNEQCAVCHAEGMPSNGKAVINPAYHMVDKKIYLRDVDHAGAVFAWDGTNHSTMDNFCFACHDTDGAVSTDIQALNPAATAKNPFADTLTNGYDVVTRGGVVDVKSAFAPGNASHHAVSAPKYKYRFSTRENADNWSLAHGGAAGDIPASQVAEEARVAGDSTLDAWDTAEVYLPAGPEKGGEATLFEAGKFVSTYTPLGASESVADNSTLHCGDCHTVGQWKPASSSNADGSATSVAIGAHGSANEYLLRNSAGTDALATPRTLVCFNCHKTTFPAGNVTNYNQVTGYATAHAVSAFHGQCIADSMLQVGATNRLQGSERVDKQATWATANGGTSTNAGSGNITGISCINCHNSGLRSSFGGIHGGDNTYTDGLGRTQKSYRFMPGMGNYRYAPPGGWDGRDNTDITLVTQPSAGVGGGKNMGGCYTNSALTGSDPNTGYSSCNHHGTSTARSYSNTGVNAGNGPYPYQRESYGGGNTASPTAVEPVVREATGGNTLVTRPLKY